MFLLCLQDPSIWNTLCSKCVLGVLLVRVADLALCATDNDLIRMWPAGHNQSIVRYYVHSIYSLTLRPNSTSAYKQVSPTSPIVSRFQRQFLDFSPLLRHLTEWFYLSGIRPSKRGREGGPPALTYIQEPQSRVSEKAQRINLQLLQLNRHMLLYLFNHTCLWTVKKKII